MVQESASRSRATRVPLPAAGARLRADRPDRVLRRRQAMCSSAATQRRSSPSCGDEADVLPSVPRIFEKVYTWRSRRRAGARRGPGQVRQADRDRLRRSASSSATASRSRGAARGLRGADAEMFAEVRALFGGRIEPGGLGAAPIAPDILRFFSPRRHGARGLRDDRDDGGRHARTLEHWRFGTVGRAVPGVEVRIADDGEIQMRGPNILKEYWRNPEATAEALPRTGSSDRRPGRDRRRRLPLDHRPQEGHHHHGRRQEPRARQRRERPQAVAVDLAGRDVRRPQALPGGGHHARPRGGRPVGRGERAARRRRGARRATRRCAR